MDVVRSVIQGLGGRVTIASVPGKGTTLSISLPLTLAVLDGMVVDVAGQTMVVPITAIIETLRPAAADIHQVAAAGMVVAVRQTFVPIIDLAEAFGHRAATSDYTNMVLLLVESVQNERWALAVDRIYDQRQVVIKGLETNYGHVPGVAAATILGDGKIALIIDPDETAQRRLRPPPLAATPATEEV
jgi:two-component system chemotaxis sensor kinase CheA